jgi:hypothetical protein
MKIFYELHSKNEQDLHLERTIEINYKKTKTNRNRRRKRKTEI